MNYIGSKNRLSSWIFQVVSESVSLPLKELVFCDLFAGTGIVGRTFKPHVKKVIANDMEFYSYVLLKNYIGNHETFDFYPFLYDLNALERKKGMIFHEFSENGKAGRLYFSEKNGQKIDAVRQQIELWKKAGKINDHCYFFLLTSLLESADKVANTASVYGAFLKKIKASAKRPIYIEPALFTETENSHEVYGEDANSLINKISGDILYLDPPYNSRQYGANYHLLNTITKYDTFVPK
ncbi:MAG TPA: DNA adenine methylase, partial [Flavobacteriaceae bacterium]|nr:DNA adenine methylase [Flavobacteriaceae bacterium]